MQYNLLGKTGLKVSRLSFGASSLGAVFRPVDESEAIKAVHAALDCGINYFDVAPAYGGTLSETVLGKALRVVPRGRHFLSTKVGKYTKPGSYGDDVLDYSRVRIRLRSVRAPGGWAWTISISSTSTTSSTREESTPSGP
jgi:L-galactose dehydrogenase